jgi:hypothetical protein
MTTNRKTVPAQKVVAVWSPFEYTAPVGCFRLAGGKIRLEAAVAADMSDPKAMIRNAEFIEEARQMLASSGILHSYSVTAGRAPADLAIDVATGLTVASTTDLAKGDEDEDPAGDDEAEAVEAAE